MARYVRTHPAPVERDYRRYRADVRRDFITECACCFVRELYSGGPEAMELDHFRPQRRFPELKATYSNIYYACHVCNQRKSDRWPTEDQVANGVTFVDACKDEAFFHYRLASSGEVFPLTTEAAYTIDACRLNRNHLCQIRAILSKRGEFSL